ncbi:Uroporphyrinogen decarboxylase (URO-D) [Moorella glycerini]|uniref:Methylcobalamin:coenzyme M methyltransferase n=1 Tax=Neomoorella stamsii TaxID=1266720 RepID=A0A9X7J589_9FIRM|nr:MULTISPECIES: uroporphyrinogen decarboxylase family protein [Moorella]PRR74826.1 methylcobalamin:coenzyme M methyltransferase [Moorella stamsii]CEP67988.1 Uroporphyrinogen decarboxylase (URO-D) [Moorella glycerini]
MKQQMSSRERFLTALHRGQPDRVPWLEGYIHQSLADRIVGRRTNLPPGWCISPDVYPILCLDAIVYDFLPPIFATMERHGDVLQVKEPLLKSKDDLKALKEFLPDPDKPEFYASASELLAFARQRDLAAIAAVRLGVSNTYNSMGYDNFCYALYDDPEFILESMEIYGEWCIKVITHVNEMGFDAIWISEDIAFKWGPMFSPEQFRKYMLPHEKKVADHIALPKIYHTDGNPLLLLPDLLTLNINALANLEHGAVDIFKVKEEYGDKICLIGNIDLHYTLPDGTPEETVLETKEKIERVGKGGGYIIASSNGLTEYCKVENILALNGAILRYGWY